MPRMSFALDRSASTNARSTLTFVLNQDPWPVVDGWAPGAGYRLVGGHGPQRVYQKGHGFWVAPMMLALEQQGNQFTVQGWVRAGLFVRLMALFLLPAEMHINSGGFRAALPRKIARDGVNRLLTALGQPGIG